MLRAAVANYSKPVLRHCALAQLLNELAEPLGISFAGVVYDNAARMLRMTPTFTPAPIQYLTRLDFGDKIAGLEFNATGDFLVAQRRPFACRWKSTCQPITR